MTVQALFSSEELDAFYLPGGSDFLLITFSALDYSTATDAFWGRYFAQKAGFSAIGFVARRNNWYPQRDMLAAVRAASEVLARYPERISYGSSMGAYAAVKYSAALGCASCAAFGPQFSISPADGVKALAYTRYYEPELHAGMAIRRDDVCERPYIFYDPRELFDQANVAAIAAVAPQTRLVRMPFAGHDCIKVVAGQVSASNLLRTCLFGDATAVRTMCRQLRRVSPARRAGLAGALVQRRPDLAFQIVDRSAETFDKKQLATFYDSAAGASAARGDFASAEAHSLKAIALLPDRTSFLRRLGCLYDEVKRYDQALVWYDRYLALNPGDAALLNAKAGACLALNRLGAAETAASKAHDIDPKSPSILQRLSAIRAARDRHEAEEAQCQTTALSTSRADEGQVRAA